MAKALLLAAFDFSGAHADEFHDWYDLEHIPERRAIAGFGACQRWIGADQPVISVATTISIPSTCCVARLTDQLPTAIYPCGRSE
jgi:hypothetical protein